MSSQSSIFLLLSTYPLFPIAMSLEMATLSTKGAEHPIRHLVGPEGLAIISSAYLAVRFGYHEDSIYVEREVLKDDGNVEYTISQLSSVVTDQRMWSLEKGTYKVFGLFRMQMEASTQQVMPTNFTTSTVHTPVRTRTASVADVPPACTQRQPQSPIFIGDSEDDFPVEDITASTPTLFSTPMASGVHKPRLATPTSGAQPSLHPQTLFRTSAIACLKRLALRLNTKNVLKNMDYASVPHRIGGLLACERRAVSGERRAWIGEQGAVNLVCRVCLGCEIITNRSL